MAHNAIFFRELENRIMLYDHFSLVTIGQIFYYLWEWYMYGGIIIHLQLHSRMSHKNLLQNGYQCSTIICVINSKKLALCSLPLKCRVIIVWFTGAYVWSAWGKYSLSVTRKSFLPRYTSSHRGAGTKLPCLSTFNAAVIQMMGLDISSMKCSN